MIVPEANLMQDPLGRTPEAPAIASPEHLLTYGELHRLVAGTAGALEGPVALCLPNSWEAVVLILASLRAGLVACPMSTRHPPGGIGTWTELVSARVLFTRRNDLSGLSSYLPEDVLREGEGHVEDLVLDRNATIVFTTGSTGSPKAVVHSIRNHYCSAAGSNENIALTAGDRWLLSLPLWHVGGLGILFRTMLAGAAMVIPALGESLGQAIRRNNATHVSLVPTQLERLLREDRGLAPETLKAVLLGGSSVSSTLIDEALDRGYPIHTTYGMTEMSSQVTTTPPRASRQQLYTSGRILPHREIRIATDGEILLRGPVLFQGYLTDGIVQEPTGTDGWFHSGDRGVLRDDGFLLVEGRVDNMFISGGENIQPEEIERALCALPGITKAVVVPIYDETFGQRPVAFWQCTDGLFPKDKWIAELETVLPRFKIPVTFLPWPQGMLDKGGKIDRAAFCRLATIHTRR